MNDVESDERALLAAAREGLSPTPQDVARVWRATRGVLDAGGATDASLEPPSAALAPGAALQPWAVQWIGALSIALVSGAIGYAFGLRASVRPAPPALAASAPVAAASAPAHALSAPAPSANVPARAVPAPSEPHDESSAPESPPLEHAPTAELGDRARAAPRRREADAPSIEKELAAMRRVGRLLRDDEPRAALALLDELDRSIPHGRLAQERSAAAVMAHCALGHADSSRLERSFADRYPQSVYLTRVRRKCSGDLRNRPEPETHE